MSAPDAEPAPEAGVLSRTVTIVNRRGLHARAAARFVKTAERFKAEVTVARKDAAVSGLSIMGLMMLAAGPGATLELRASGEDAAAALDALVKLVADKFDED
jgi:phosphocarrier protein